VLPTLADLDPQTAAALPVEAVPAAVAALAAEQARLAAVGAALAARLTPPPAPNTPADWPDDDQLLDDRAAGDLLGVAPGCVADLRRRGELPEVRVGGKYVRVRRGDVRAYIHRDTT
jgi:hypothetical protein